MRTVIVLACTLAAGAPAWAGPRAASDTEVERRILAEANGFRESQQLAPLVEAPALSAEARAFAAYMARSGRYSHTADGHSPSERAEAAGYGYCELGENLAYLQDGSSPSADALARRFMEGWKASPPHRRSLLDPDVVDTGVGVATSPQHPSRSYAVQVFGRPQSREFSFQVSNRSAQSVSVSFQGESQRVDPYVNITYTACEPASLVFASPPVTGVATFRPERPTQYRLEPSPDGIKVEEHDYKPKGGA